MTNDIVAFIKARLDEDERITMRARRDAGDVWPDGAIHVSLNDDADVDGIFETHEVARHVSRQDPARVLRGVEVKRRIVDRHQRDELMWDDGDGLYDIAVCATCMTGRSCDHCVDRSERDLFTWPCPDLRDIASEWDTHPAYRSEWKP